MAGWRGLSPKRSKRLASGGCHNSYLVILSTSIRSGSIGCRRSSVMCSLFSMVSAPVSALWSMDSCSMKTRRAFVFLSKSRPLTTRNVTIASLTSRFACSNRRRTPSLSITGRCFEPILSRSSAALRSQHSCREDKRSRILRVKCGRC